MASIFSLDWFKSKKQKELEALKVEEQNLKNELLKGKLNKGVKEKVYKSFKLVNDVLTVVLKSGDILSKSNATVYDIGSLKRCLNEDMIFDIFVNEKQKEELKIVNAEKSLIKKVSLKLDTLRYNPDFEVKDGVVKLKGINRSVPAKLVDEFISITEAYQKNLDEDPDEALFKDEKYLSLKRFFMWCCLNPRAEVADSLYEFLMKNSFRITRQGFFVALRNVVSLEHDNGNNEAVQFISNAYNKIKAVWKKNPEKFDVYNRLGEYKLVDTDRQSPPKANNPCWERMGNLKDLYIDLPNMRENRFTDDWTKTFDIRIGKIVSMPMEECNWSTQDCAAAGLHFTADQINYVGCGDTSVLMLINPMKVVGIGSAKGRCYEYLPIMTVPREEATQILHDLDFDTIDLDEFYVEEQLEDLSKKAMEGFAEEAKKHQFNIPSISIGEVNNIVESLEMMKNEVGKRVQEVV